MPEQVANESVTVSRRKRINRIKRILWFFIAVFILLPTVMCIVLMTRLGRMERNIDYLQEQMLSDTDVVPAESQTVYGENQEMLSGEEDNPVLAEQPDAETAADEKLVIGDSDSGTREDGNTPVEDNRRKVYLTFDDGPSMYTDDILDILAEYDVKATFFVLPKEGETYAALYNRILEEGHSLGMHSYTHVYEDIYTSLETFSEDVTAIQEFLYGVTGYESHLYRFPGGSSNSYCRNTIQDYISYLNDSGIAYFDWNVSSQDASGTMLTKDQIVTNVISRVGAYDEAVILMHDAASKRTTVEALPEIIESILGMEDTVILPITEETIPVQHRKANNE